MGAEGGRRGLGGVWGGLCSWLIDANKILKQDELVEVRYKWESAGA